MRLSGAGIRRHPGGIAGVGRSCLRVQCFDFHRPARLHDLLEVIDVADAYAADDTADLGRFDVDDGFLMLVLGAQAVRAFVQPGGVATVLADPAVA